MARAERANGADFDSERPVVKRMAAGAWESKRGPPGGASSVIGLTGARVLDVPAKVNPADFPVMPGGPPPKRSSVPTVAYNQRLFALLRSDEGRVMPEKQANSLAGWCRAHGHRVVRRIVGHGQVGVWLAEPKKGKP